MTKGTEEEHEKKVKEVFQKLDKRKLQLKEEKCQIAENGIDSISYRISKNGIKPQNEKIQTKSAKLQPKNLKDLGQ